MDMRPFTYGMKIVSVYNDGTVLDPEFVSMTSNDYQN